MHFKINIFMYLCTKIFLFLLFIYVILIHTLIVFYLFYCIDLQYCRFDLFYYIQLMEFVIDF